MHVEQYDGIISVAIYVATMGHMVVVDGNVTTTLHTLIHHLSQVHSRVESRGALLPWMLSRHAPNRVSVIVP